MGRTTKRPNDNIGVEPFSMVEFLLERVDCILEIPRKSYGQAGKRKGNILHFNLIQVVPASASWHSKPRGNDECSIFALLHTIPDVAHHSTEPNVMADSTVKRLVPMVVVLFLAIGI